MLDYIVYAPFSGTGKGQDCYCVNCANGSACNNGGYCTPCGSVECKHKSGITGLCCPVDINGPANGNVMFWGNGIASVRVIRKGPYDPPDYDALCSVTPPGNFGWVNEGVKVELYCNYNAVTFLGAIYYGHLRNRQNNGVYNDPNGLYLGQLGNVSCGCNCYPSSIHVHMERQSTGFTYRWSCGTLLYVATSPVFRFTGPVCGS